MIIEGLEQWGDLAVLHRFGDTLVARGTTDGGAPVLVKTHARQLPTGDTRERLRREYLATRAATHEHLVAAHALVDRPTRAALVLDDPGSTSLADAVQQRSVDLVAVLDAAVAAGAALAALHAAGMVHRAVDGRHVVRSPSGWVLVDLYDACPAGSRPARGSSGAHPAPEEGAEGSPAAAAIDQHALASTVRHACDALGIEPPDGLLAVLDRALRADPRHRYRSVLGLVDGLRQARDRLAAGAPCQGISAAEGMPLAWEDPTEPVGREPLLAELEAAVAAAAADQTGHVVVVRGPAGSGRSSLLTALCDRLADRGVICGLGQFRQGGVAVPLRAQREVMDQVVARLLATPDQTLDAVRDDLVARLGPDLQLAVELVPALTHVLGEQPPAPHVPAEEAVHRVERAIRCVAGAIAEQASPLVAAYDDADLADDTALATLQVLAGHPDVGPMVVVLTASPAAPALHGALERLRSRGVRIREVDLEPLDRAAVRQILAHGTGLSADAVAPLADAVWHRSGGNPRVALADVWSLVESRDLRPDTDLGRWRWSPAALEHDAPTTPDELAVGRVGRLGPDAVDALTVVAAAGNLATPQVVASALGMDAVGEAEPLVERAVGEHVVARLGDGRLVCADDDVRRVVLGRLAETDRHRLERSVADAVLAATPVDEHGEPALTDPDRFELVRLLSGSPQVQTDPVQRERFVRLCEQAARSAHRGGAFRVALDLQRAAIAAAGERGWAEAPDRAFELHLRAAEHALMVGLPGVVDELLAAAWAHGPTAVQRVRAMRVLGTRAWTRDDPDGGLAEAREVLRQLGEPIPERPTAADLAREWALTRAALGTTPPESFLTADRLQDERMQAVLDAMLGCVHLAYVHQPLTHVLLVLRGTRLTARHGVADASAYFLTGYGMLSLSLPRGVARGLRFGHVGMELASGTGRHVLTMVGFAHNSFVRHWGEPLEATIEPMMARYRESLADRQRGYGLTGGTFAVLHALLAGRPLRALELEASGMALEMERLGERAFQQRVEVVQQAVHELRHGSGQGPWLDGEHFASGSWFAARPRRGELAVIVHTLRAAVALRFGDLDAARDEAAAAAPLLRTAPGQAVLGLHAFHVALLDAVAAAGAGSRDRSRRRLQAERSLHRLRRQAHHAPANAAHRVALVEAVLAEGRPGRRAAARLVERYATAVELATANGALHDLGLIAERAAGVHAARGDLVLARHYVVVARNAWQAWGADALAGSMVRRVPAALVDAAPDQGDTRPAPSAAAAVQAAGSASTPGTFAEAGRLLGQELEVREFLERLLEVLMRHVDASRGFLVLASPAGPVVEVAARRAGDVVDVLAMPSPRLEDHEEMCVPAVAYALRTRQVLAVPDPAEDRRFRADGALRRRAPRALLCLPIGRSTGTSGVLVLESDTHSHAFDAERIEALRVLSAQAISTIDHARLASDLTSLSDDVAELRATAEELTRRAETDALTGLVNRAGLESGLQAAIRAAHLDRSAGVAQLQRQVGVLFCDLDGFKAVNDRHGHAAGDEVLRKIAERLRRVVRARDIVARVGGDEFVVVSVDVDDEELAAMAERARQEVARPVDCGAGGTHTVSVSIGVGRAGLDHVTTVDDVDALVQVADEAMYRAKHGGRNQVEHG